MFDSWEGLSKPTDEDGIYWSEHDLMSSLKVCKRNLLPLDKEFLILLSWLDTRHFQRYLKSNIFLIYSF